MRKRVYFAGFIEVNTDEQFLSAWGEVEAAALANNGNIFLTADSEEEDAQAAEDEENEEVCPECSGMRIPCEHCGNSGWKNSDV